MDNNVFCCSNVQPYRPKTLDHEPKFCDFISWAKGASLDTSGASGKPSTTPGTIEHYPYAVQLVRQVNYGSLESKRHFVSKNSPTRDFLEITVDDLVNANFEKINSYKTFTCPMHDKFFEVNLYQKHQLNRHHWRAIILRPEEQIDSPTKPKKAAWFDYFQLSQQVLNKSLAQVTKQQHISPKTNPRSGGTKFSHDPTFGTLSVTLPSVAVDFNGDLLSPVVLNVQASKVNAPVGLEPAWTKLLSAGKIARFIIDYGHGYELFASTESESLIGVLEKRVATSLKRKTHQPCRARLGKLLVDMRTILGGPLELRQTARPD